MSRYIIGMVPLVMALFVLGYLFYVRKISPVDLPAAESKQKEILAFFHGLWPILLALLIIVIFELRVSLSVLIVIALQLLIERVKWSEVKSLAVSAVEKRVLLMIAAVMVFKEVLEYSGAMSRIAQSVSSLTLSPAVIFSIIFFLSSIMIGSSGAIAVFIPMAYAAMPDGGVPLLILLMAMAYAAMQVAPTHICLGIAVNEFKTTMDQMIRKASPVIAVFVVVTIIYYQILKLIF